MLDVSKSMDERAAKGQPSRLESLISAATGFVDTVLPSGSNNRVAVVVYGTRAGFFGDLSNPFFTDAGDVNDLIEDIESDAYTNMHEGMLVANGIMEHHARSDANKIIVFMSDGVPNRYMLGLSVVGNDYPTSDDDYDHSNYNPYAASAFQSAATTAKDPSGLDITVLTVGLFQGMGDTEKGLAVANLTTAASTGGYFEADTPDSLDDIYDLIGEEITTMVGSNVVIHDYVPERFTLDESSLNPSVGTAEYKELTREILWTVGILNPGTITLAYTLEANEPWYGALFTNREMDEDGKQGAYMVIDLAAGLGEETIQFPDPGVRIRPYAEPDTYTIQMNEPLAVPVPGSPYNGLLFNDRDPDVNTFRNELPFEWSFPEEPRLQVVDPDSIIPPAGCTLEVEEDGSFEFTPPADTFGTFTFYYRNFVNSSDTPKETSRNLAPMLAAVNGGGLDDSIDEMPAYYMLASDLVKVSIIVEKPEEPDTTRVFVQKYIGETNTVSGPGFSFEVHPDEMILYEDTPTVYPVGPTNESGLAFVDLPNGMYVLVEKDLVGYTNDLGDGFHFMVYGGTAADHNDKDIPNNTIIVHNIPDETPTPTPIVTPTDTPTQVPTSPPTPTDPPTPSTNVALIVEVVGPGTALPYSGAYGLDAVVQLSATPNEGAVFTGWTGPDGGAVDSNNRIVLSTSRHVIANFEIPAPPPTPTPEPEPEAIIPEPVIPEGPPEVEEVMMEETVPQAAPILPKTAGLPLAALLALGATAITSGIWRKRK